MSPTVICKSGLILATLKVAFPAAYVNNSSPAYSTVTSYLPAARPDNVKTATPFATFSVYVLPFTVIVTVPVALLFKLTTTVAVLP